MSYGSDVDGVVLAKGDAQKNCVIADARALPWRGGALFDAMVCDLPYGVRELQIGSSGLGLLDHVLLTARTHLKPGGRIALWWFETSQGAAAADVHAALELLPTCS